jgi:hypothetical protein
MGSVEAYAPKKRKVLYGFKEGKISLSGEGGPGSPRHLVPEMYTKYRRPRPIIKTLGFTNSTLL